MDTLKEGEHTLKVVFNDGGEALTSFKVLSNQIINNPKTNDGINSYVMIIILSTILLISSIKLNKKMGI